MAQASKSGGNTLLAMVVGGLLVALAGIGWMVWSRGQALTPDTRAVDLSVRIPEPPDLPSPAPMPQPQPAPLPGPPRGPQ
jgi:hypothetical protein